MASGQDQAHRGGKGAIQSHDDGSGYASSSAVPVHFGLGDARVASEIEIRWPSGTVQKIENVAADRVLQGERAPVNSTSDHSRNDFRLRPLAAALSFSSTTIAAARAPLSRV